ncbi:TIGR02587 family membrane protein [Ramlibacter terrae]|uniref:TIGR02587 family membrane protein n=1 Tax=Ramlibacter terrae TaxID=2732511 RepID=A0ABX6P5K4_9BURK|nr:TIGR02587 family membrane protein [Ramlibacter terrae]
MKAEPRETNAMFARGLARAFAGAVIFGLPLLMTMEMWWLGFHMEPERLALLLAVFCPFPVALSWHSGFEPTFSWRDDVLDALVAYAVGIVSSLVILLALGLLEPGMAWREIVGKVTLQAIPASIGALLAQTQLGQRDAPKSTRGGAEGYVSELFIMGIGALFLAFNLAPTDEMLVIGLQVTEWQAVVVMVMSLAAMHAFVYSVAFRGTHEKPSHASGWSIFLRFTVTGYALALLLSAWILWSFGRFDGLSLLHVVKSVAVLAFPAAIGAAAARLIL